MSRVKHTESFEFNQPIDILFPLFSAEGEKLWVPGWDYENIMGSTDLHEDYIFLTRTHDHATTDAIWLVKRYDPAAYFVSFYKVEPGDKVGVITVQCTATGQDTTRVEVSYEYIGLSPEGNAFVAGFTSEEYRAFIGEWQTLLTAYFSEQP